MHPKIYTILQVCLLSLTGYSQAAFVTVWSSENAGISSNNQIVIPGEGIDYDIAWELVADPMVSGNLIGNNTTTVTFPTPGIYRVSITPGSGTFHRMFFNGLGDSQKLVTIEQWGDIQWSSMNNAFAGCSQMNCTAMDAPDLTNVTDLSYMFLNCDLFNGQIGSWDVSGVTRMSCMFNYAYAFNQDIGSWDVSAVTDMDSMFLYATSFNQNIWLWDISNVTSMRFMFMNATSFNQPLGNWYVPNVVDMSGMFSGATSFNQYLGSWGLNPLVDVQEMLNNCGMSCENYDITLQFWSLEPGTPDNLVLGAAGRTYWLSGASRDNLISAKGWTITGDTFEECEYGSLVCNNVEMMLSQEDFTNGIYLLPAASLVDNATGYEVYVKRLYSSCIDFDWTTEGACMDSDPNGIIDDFDLGLEHRACLPIALCDTEIDYEVRFVDPILGNWVFYCSGTLTIDLQAPIPGCTLPFAHNYNPLAETDDGSCETCIDGIQNGDETSIDCGGTLCPPCEICELPDRDAMIALYHAFNGQNWGFPWDTTACYCEWQGVVCDETDRVKELELTSVLGFSGYVPIEIGNLSNLERLYLRQLPDLTDTLPASLGNLTALNVLEIIDCNITGQIPASLGNLSNLWEFRLDENSLSGALPAELAGIMNPLLHTLRLNDNTLSGCFPNEYHVFCTAQLVYKEFYNNSGLPNGGDFSAFCQTGEGSCETCDDGLLNGDEEGIDCGGSCSPCPPPSAACGVITVYVDPGSPEFDGPGNNNIWWIPAELLDAGSVSAYELPTTSVKRYLSNITFDWTTNGACIDATPNGGSLSNADKGTIYRPCLPVRNADFNTWKLYQLQISDPAGTDGCSGMVRVMPQNNLQSGLPSHIIHYMENDDNVTEEVHGPNGDIPLVKPMDHDKMILSPNPGESWFNLSWESTEQIKTEVVITDSKGLVVKNIVIEEIPASNILQVDMGRVAEGMYIVRLQNDKGMTVMKWCKAE